MTTALDYLAAPDKHPLKAFNVLSGDEAFLMRLVLNALIAAARTGGDDAGATTFLDGPQADAGDVLHQLAARSLFSKERPLVVVQDADTFVTQNRARLETQAAAPKGEGILILLVSSFPKNTKLFAHVEKQGLWVDCKAPEGLALQNWLAQRAEREYGKKLEKDAAHLMVELVGGNLGILDRELSKLCDWAGGVVRLTAEHVHEVVGGWKTKTAWEMLDQALDGKGAEALRQLHKLLSSGEQPIGILAQISATLRRFAGAATLVTQAEAEGRKLTPGDALRELGTPPFAVKSSEARLKRLGRARASQLYRRLLQTDLDLKGDSPLPPRVVLETLIVRIASGDP